MVVETYVAESTCVHSRKRTEKRVCDPSPPWGCYLPLHTFHCCAIGGTLKRLREKKKSVVNRFLMMPARKVYLSSFCEVKIAQRCVPSMNIKNGSRR